MASKKGLRIADETARLLRSGAVAKPAPRMFVKLSKERLRRSYTCRKA